MSLLVRADNGSQWQTIGIEKLSFESTAKVLLISEELAEKLLRKGDLWRSVSPPKTVKDEFGVNHVCKNAIKISYRWGNETSTQDAKVYVSSRVKQTPRPNGKNVKATVQLLVPDSFAPLETDSAPTVQPIYHLPPQTQEDKDRQQKSNSLADKAHTDAMTESHTKKEKRFEEAWKKPANVTTR
ncbi:hypothetical protein H2200_010765 [Cladophialophora chaetospira]|uniref:Uncharacterized protein n=1 Tax=Cladophialophora chaetospira TaxID=386627 RepID=A0AA38X0P8_9EURO|nr:hypothetical protein H2200_010765 [Cladophialophora chaetospira]